MLRRLISHRLCAIIVLSIVLRTAVMVRGTGSFDDPDNYLPMARSLATGHGFSLNGRPTAYRPPLYPLILSPIVSALDHCWPWEIALLHLALGAGTVILTGMAATRFGLSPNRVVAAAFIVACDPVLIWQSRSVMTETPAAFLTAATLAGIATGGVFWGGLGFGLAGLCRPSLLVGATLTGLAGLIARPGDIRRRLWRSVGLVLMVSVVLCPWMIRNLVLFGKPVWTTTHGGYTLALANNPVYYREVLNGPAGRVWTGQDQWLWWDSINRKTAGMTEPQADRYLTATVKRLILEHPGDFLRATLARLGRFWSVAPAVSVYSSSVRWATFAWTLPLWIAMAMGCLQGSLWQWPRISAPMIVIGLTLVHAFYWTDLRMRAPIVPAIALIAAGAAIPGNRVGLARSESSDDRAAQMNLTDGPRMI